MARKINLDFKCPQFVDFAAELSNSSKDDLFFDCMDHQSPGNVDGVPNSTPRNEKEKCPVEEEDRLLDKMTAALSIIENTPKLKGNAIKGKLLAEKFISIPPKTTKPALKASTVPAPPVIRRSKSITHMDKIIAQHAMKFKSLRKRSSSLNDLRTLKKQRYPVTPMCLKRTTSKMKGKVFKTTEELELEEIAKLQKQLIDHLRINEMNLRKFKSKPKQWGVGIPKSTHRKTVNITENKSSNLLMEKSNVSVKESRQDIPALNHASLKNKAMKLDGIINKHLLVPNTVDKIVKDDKKFPLVSSVDNSVLHEKSKDQGVKKPVKLKDDQKSKYPSVSAVDSSALSVKNKSRGVQKPVSSKRYAFHCGLIFHENVKKNTAVQPFSFDSKIRDKQLNASCDQKSEVSLSSSSKKHIVACDKENILCDKKLTTRKTVFQFAKYDIAKQLASNKKNFQKRVTNPVKGLPLTENFRRD